MSEPLWHPDPDRIARANLTAFRQLVGNRYQIDAFDYDTLWQWSVDHREDFWSLVWDFTDVVAEQRWDEALLDGDALPGAKRIVGARLNSAENLLRHYDHHPALIFVNERGQREELSYADLHEQTTRLAAAMRRMGIGCSDRVAAMMPNMPQTIVAMLAAASLGAVFSSCSPDFGTAGVLDRFGQIEPKLLVAVDGYHYGGKAFDCLERLAEIEQGMPSLEATLIVDYLRPRPDLSRLKRALHYRDALEQDALEQDAGELEYRHLPPDHPLYILFSSGTTGVPKCIVHSAGGTLLQHRKEHVLHCDLKRQDRLFYFTTCGWMMWNWLASGLASGATLILYDGSPFHPGPEALFDLIEGEAITIFGTSAKYLAAIEKNGLQPKATHRLHALRTILSTGSPLAPESYDFVYRQIKEDIHLASISGGTDLVSCFALGDPAGSVYRGEIQARGLGMDVAVFSPRGEPLVGEPGELVCRQPFPSVPLGFWNDPDGQKLRAAYFERFPGVWHHGDWATLTERGSIIIHGRSDAVLNPGGVRIGTAEIYRLVEQIPAVLESIAVGQQWDGDERVVLFVKLRTGESLTEELRQQLRQHLRQGATPRHVPSKILQVADIPRTKSGKIVEIAVRDVIHHRPVRNAEALANPAALDYFRDREELLS